MQIARVTRVAVRRVLSLAVIGLVATVTAIALIPSSASGAATAPHSTKTLALDVNLLGLGVHVAVPLSLNDLLNRASSTPPPPSSSAPPPTSSTPAPPTTSVPAPPTTSAPTSRSQQTQPRTSPVVPNVPPPLAGGGGGASTSANPTRTSTKAHSGTHTVQATRSRASSSSNQVVLAKRILPSNGPALLITLLAITALGVAVVVRMSGRRGGQHR